MDGVRSSPPRVGVPLLLAETASVDARTPDACGALQPVTCLAWTHCDRSCVCVRHTPTGHMPVSDTWHLCQTCPARVPSPSVRTRGPFGSFRGWCSQVRRIARPVVERIGRPGWPDVPELGCPDLDYKGTSLIRKRLPPGTYGRTLPRALLKSSGAVRFFI